MIGKRFGWILALLLALPFLTRIARRPLAALGTAWQDWRYPAPKGPAVSTLGQEIVQKDDSQAMDRFLREYQRVQSLVNANQDQGVDISDFQGRLKISTILARQRQFRLAMSVLNRIEMSLPHPQQNLVPQIPSDASQAPRRAVPSP